MQAAWPARARAQVLADALARAEAFALACGASPRGARGRFSPARARHGRPLPSFVARARPPSSGDAPRPPSGAVASAAGANCATRARTRVRAGARGRLGGAFRGSHTRPAATRGSLGGPRWLGRLLKTARYSKKGAPILWRKGSDYPKIGAASLPCETPGSRKCGATGTISRQEENFWARVLRKRPLAALSDPARARV